MRTIQLKDEIYDWHGKAEILHTPLYKITLTEPAKIMEIITDSSNGIVILGRVEAIVDAIVYTDSHGAVGSTTTFSGTNLVILGLPITDFEGSLKKSDLDDQERLHWKNEAYMMIRKIKRRIEDPGLRMHLDFKDDEEFDYFIFGRRNFLLVGSERKFVLIHNKQISVRDGERKLVQVGQDGIVITKRNKVLNIGGTSRNNLGSLLGEFGVNIASLVLDQIIWD